MYNYKFNSAQMKEFEFSSAFLNTSSTFESKVSYVLSILRKARDSFKGITDGVASLLAYAAEPAIIIFDSIKDLIPNFTNSTFNFKVFNDDTKTVLAKGSDFGSSLLNAVQYQKEEFSFHVTDPVEGVVEVKEKVLDFIERQAGSSDVAELQVAAIKAAMADAVSDARLILEEALNNVSSVNYAYANQVVNDLNGFIEDNKESKETCVLYVLNSFGLSELADGSSAQNSVWSGITGFSTGQNLLVALRGFGTVIINVIVTTFVTIFRLIGSLLKWVIQGIISIINTIVAKIKTAIYYSTVGQSIHADGGSYGWSSRYNRRFVTVANTYPAWYLYTHGYLDGFGLTITLLNVRCIIRPNSNDPIEKDITWTEWIQGIHYFQCELSVAPLYGPSLLNFCQKLISDGVFTGSAWVFGSSQASGPDVQSTDYVNHVLDGWDISNGDCDVILEIFNRWSNTALLPDNGADQRGVARSFLWGHVLADLILAFPFNDLHFSNEEFSPSLLSSKIRLWMQIFIKQMFFWGCIDVGAPGWTNEISVITDSRDDTLEYNTSWPETSASIVSWRNSWYAHVPWVGVNSPSGYPHLISYLGSIKSADASGIGFGSNVWFAILTSTARAINADYQETDESVNFRNVIADDEDGIYAIFYGTVRSCLGELRTSDFVRDDLFSRYSTMILQAWNNYDYAGSFSEVVNQNPSKTDNDFYIYTTAEETAAAAAFGERLANQIVITAAVIAVAIVAWKLFKSWRSASFVADTAAFNYGDAMAQGDHEGAATYLGIYKRSKWTARLIGWIAPVGLAKTAASGILSVASGSSDSGEDVGRVVRLIRG